MTREKTLLSWIALGLSIVAIFFSNTVPGVPAAMACGGPTSVSECRVALARMWATQRSTECPNCPDDARVLLTQATVGRSTELSAPATSAGTSSARISSDVTSAISFFKSLFILLLALAMGEAFKQFVADKVDQPKDHATQLNRLPTLITFLVTIIPFFQGMYRYFDKYYQDIEWVSRHYPRSLIVDGIAFTIEAALFFVLSRALSPGQLRRVIKILTLVFVTDLSRDLTGFVLYGELSLWFIQNLISAIVLIFMLWLRCPQSEAHSRIGRYSLSCPRAANVLNKVGGPFAIALAILATLATVVDYYLHWSLYFPPLTQ